VFGVTWVTREVCKSSYVICNGFGAPSGVDCEDEGDEDMQAIVSTTQLSTLFEVGLDLEDGFDSHELDALVGSWIEDRASSGETFGSELVDFDPSAFEGLGEL